MTTRKTVDGWGVVEYPRHGMPKVWAFYATKGEAEAALVQYRKDHPGITFRVMKVSQKTDTIEGFEQDPSYTVGDPKWNGQE